MGAFVCCAPDERTVIINKKLINVFILRYNLKLEADED